MTNEKKQQYLWWSIIGGVIALTLVGIIWLAANSESEATGATAGQIEEDLPPVTADDWSWGPTDAQVTLIEYGDFQCPACGSFYSTIRGLRDDYGDRVRFVFRHYPLTGLHPNGMISAQAAEAAGLQDKFWEMEGKLYDSQNDWSSLSRSAAQEKFLEYAAELGMNKEQFQKDLVSGEVAAAIADDQNGGNRANVNGTPTLFMNGVHIRIPSSYAQLRSTIDAELAASAATPVNTTQ